MTKECFDELCDDIIENVGEEEFKSEEFIHAKLHVERDELPFITSKKKKSFCTFYFKWWITFQNSFS